MQEFIRGLELCGAFYREAIAPILRSGFPRVRYAAALLGPGSEVLGFDTERSTDHHWGPRLQLFLSRADHAAHATAITETLARELPVSIRGYATHWGPPAEDNSRFLVPVEHGPVDHRVDVVTVGTFMRGVLGVDAPLGVTVADWLATPSQLLRSVTAGAVYVDEVGELTSARRALAWYPRDVWLYLIACGWRRISQEEAFVGRCGEVGDDLGSRVLAARLVRDVVKLAFLLERQYAPYSKWVGTAFSNLPCAATLAPPLYVALAASAWPERGVRLAEAYTVLATLHNRLGITAPLDPSARPYFSRPFPVLRAERFAEATRAAIQDAEVLALEPWRGGIDQWVDSTDALSGRSSSR